MPRLTLLALIPRTDRIPDGFFVCDFTGRKSQAIVLGMLDKTFVRYDARTLRDALHLCERVPEADLIEAAALFANIILTKDGPSNMSPAMKELIRLCRIEVDPMFSAIECEPINRMLAKMAAPPQPSDPSPLVSGTLFGDDIEGL